MPRGLRFYGQGWENVTVKLKKRENGSIQVGVTEELARASLPDRIVCATALFLAAFLHSLLTGRSLRCRFPGAQNQESPGDGCCKYGYAKKILSHDAGF